ncbi:MAG: PQQ-binding-like beta-propeller repeat protein [Solirubrobacterales bacterium]
MQALPKNIVDLWKNHRLWVLAGGTTVLVLVAGVAIYLAFIKRPGDKDCPDPCTIETEAEMKPTIGVADWPHYGLNPERARYLNAPEVKPPYLVKWRFKGRRLLEYSPILVGGSLYGINNNGLAFSVKTRSGKARWKREVAGLNASAPAYSQGKGHGIIYLSNLEPGQVLALDARDGKQIWRRALPGRTESSPLVVGNKVVVGCECGTLFAFDRETGKSLWETNLGGEIKAAPAYHDGVVFVGTYGGDMNAIRIDDGSTKWSTSAQGSSFGRTGRIYATAAIGFGRVYVGSIDSRMYSFDEETGDLAWSQSTGGYVYAGAVVADTPSTDPSVYFGSYDGTFYALDAKTGDERWSANPGGSISGAASLIGDTVYVADLNSTETTGYSAGTGKEVFNFRDGAYNPVISDGKRLYLTGYKTLYALLPISEAEIQAKAKAKAAKAKAKRNDKKKGAQNKN